MGSGPTDLTAVTDGWSGGEGRISTGVDSAASPATRFERRCTMRAVAATPSTRPKPFAPELRQDPFALGNTIRRPTESSPSAGGSVGSNPARSTPFQSISVLPRAGHGAPGALTEPRVKRRPTHHGRYPFQSSLHPRQAGPRDDTCSHAARG